MRVAGRATEAVTAAPAQRGALWQTLGMSLVIAALHIAGVVLLLIPVHSDGRPIALGIGLTAYTLGLRHAFDADHIAAIDNTTRRLIDDRRSPVSVGFWFSLGHSSVVFALTLLLALGARALVAPIQDEGSPLHLVTGIVGTTVSVAFLYTIAALNLVLLFAGVRRLEAVRAGRLAAETAGGSSVGGPMARVFGRVLRSIRRPRQMYPLGVLFGLGFDTATEVALLVVAATSAAAGTPWYVLLALPLLFAAGMSLLDTADGVVMRFAYGWAFARPERRIRYNLVVTALSVTIALIIGSVQLTTLLGRELQLSGGFWAWVQTVDLNALGFGVAALLLVVWLIAVCASALRRNRGSPEEFGEE